MTPRDVLGGSGASGPLLVAGGTTVLATALSYGLPEQYAATGVGLCFLGATYVLVWRSADAATIREFGLSLAGLFEPEPLSPRRLVSSALRALLWALAAALLIFPGFWFGYRLWYAPGQPFAAPELKELFSESLGQLLGVAFPEEAFYRGYLQSALARAWRPKPGALYALLSPALLVASAVFAFGHLLTEPVPARLAVFFPALVFGWLRTQSGGIGAAILFHALCNLFTWYLGKGYGLFG